MLPHRADELSKQHSAIGLRTVSARGGHRCTTLTLDAGHSRQGSHGTGFDHSLSHSPLLC